MAEGGINRPAAKLKPVPPPKPICTPPGNLKRDSRKLEHIPTLEENTSQTLNLSDKSNIIILNDQKINACQEEAKIQSIKPPLLPKPTITPRVPNCSKTESGHRKSLFPASAQKKQIKPVLENENAVLKKTLPKLHIPNCLDKDFENGCISNTKAPVAKLDEFDYLPEKISPVRPPRSPKHKVIVGTSFTSECSKESLFTSRNCNSHQIKKSASLSRAEAFLFESKYKTQSSESNSITDGRIWKGKSPVPPPRRRNKSIPQSPEFVSQFSENTFGIEIVPQKIPIYAEINYNLKKNRRVDAANVQAVSNNSEEVVRADIDIEQKDNSAVDVPLQKESRVHNSGEQNNVYLNCDVKETKEIDSEIKCKEDNLECKYISFPITPNVLDSCIGNDCYSEECSISSADKGLKETLLENSMTHSDFSLYPAGQLSEVCSELCTDCLSANILEESFDSVSSSKLEWQSVQSSFNSSGSGSIFEPAQQQLSTDIVISEELSEDRIKDLCLSEDKSKKETTSHISATYDAPVSINSHKDAECTATNLNFRTSNENNTFSYSSHAKEERTETFKRLSSSLPNHGKSMKKHHRRKSWNGGKDSNYYVDWNFFKHSSWIDEGDSSSGNLGDLDSSDNATKKNSVEEIDQKSKLEHTASRKLTLWWSSFGKGGRKHRSNKRHSYFYCKKQDSSELDESLSKDNVCEEVKYHSIHSNMPSRSDASGSSMPFVSLPALSIQQDVQNLNAKYTSEDSFISDIHSDSEGEDVNLDSSSCDKTSLSTEKCYDEKKAFLIAKELMTSEKVFINALKLLNIDFREWIHNSCTHTHGHPVIPETEFHKIINSLPQLQRLNEDLLRDLEERIQNWSAFKKIADVIVKKGPFLKLYTTYIQNFETQCNYFDECCQKYPKFSKAVREFEASSICQKLSVKHYMLKPVQRIPQYRLLLDDYHRHLAPDSPDYEDTKLALKIVCDVAEHANRSIKLGDHLSVLLQLQSQLENYEIIKPGRILLKDGELHKLSRKERQPRYFILLNDCLLYTSYYGSGPSSGLKVNSELSLGGMKVTTSQAEGYHNEFSIITSTRSFTLSARSSNERREWVEALQTAIQEYTSRQLSFQFQKFNVSRSDGSSEPFKLGKEAPIWIQDGRVTKCQSCVAEFTVTFRRHHCRACGKVVCGLCSAFRAPLQYMKFQADRVCEECFNTLISEFDNPSVKISEVIRDALGWRKCDQNKVGYIRSQFKRLGPSSGKKMRKHIPQRLLEVTANDAGSQMCGWLQRRSKRSWKRLWFVLKEQVLYVYKASEDVVAHESIPVLGYKVEPMKQIHFQMYEGIDAKLVFQLAHLNQPPIVFSADSENLANRWISALQEATVLK